MLKIIKWVLIVIVALAALLWGGGYFLSPKFTVARSVTINAPADKVYALVANPREWKKWSVWNQRDPAMQITYEGPESGAGAKWTWKSKSEGDGSMTFTKAEPGKMVGYDLYFPDFKTTSAGDLTLTPEGQGTKITWTMNGDMGSNPLFRWFALNADSMVGKDFQAGLDKLKAVAEKS
ncbi:MAG: SRPBCC family protein [Burkholderiaceae bacterium]